MSDHFALHQWRRSNNLQKTLLIYPSKQHRAVASVNPHNLEEVLFFTKKHCSHNHIYPALMSSLCTSDSLVIRLVEFESNPEQRKAVQHIVAGTAKPAPYLVSGPPSIGKTVTLVGAINHILKAQQSCNTLACAPSDNAINHLL